TVREPLLSRGDRRGGRFPVGPVWGRRWLSADSIADFFGCAGPGGGGLGHRPGGGGLDLGCPGALSARRGRSASGAVSGAVRGTRRFWRRGGVCRAARRRPARS